ncbi:hypothetical protein DFA_06956 [Cavenderia fasciculata]|uniref:Uncharacterized protein n=1 Tax=Cavenderia fasciculata TaxID=261658 RepID=F4PX50_CACFS|nr:uncharacterized protein DFA_06956 [Cavenderia fasciculata]EGG19853.1 hypothetical protein DFA_06956 [Cavenderia fasciculata]|eukprot:XP_004358199.1 hypothetical protein DFA_06956 [Cavenderia fasciculata]
MVFNQVTSLRFNEKYNSYFTYYNGNYQNSAGSSLSTGKYSPGDPYGQPFITASGTGSGGGSSSEPQNGCSIKFADQGYGSNVAYCNNNGWFPVTCTPPYNHA